MIRTELVEVGMRVAYEDQANPRREGRVTEIVDDGRQYRIAWDDEAAGSEFTYSDLRQRGWDILADAPGSFFDGFPIISIYTRTDAIRDGVLVPVADLVPDEPLFASQAGWSVHPDLTSAVAEIILPTEREAERGQDVKGRLWDLLSMARMYARKDDNQWLFPCIFQLAGPTRTAYRKNAGQKTLHFKVVLGQDYDGAPTVTIMLPHED